MNVIVTLAEQLSESGTAKHDAEDRVARTQLVEAAKLAGVRVTIVKCVDGGLEARALSPEQGEAQRVRGVVFHAVNKMKQGLGTLTSGAIDTEPISDEVQDLRELIEDLEEYARELLAKVQGNTVNA